MTSTERLRRSILAGAAVLSPVLLAIGLLVMPGDVPDGPEELVAFVADGSPDRWYAAHLLVALGFVLLPAVALATALVVRARGAALATWGSLVLIVGGIAFGAAMFMYGATTYLAATNERLTGGSGVDFQTAAEDSGVLGAPFPIGFFSILIGSVLCAIALWLSRRVPVWAALAVGLLMVAVFVGFEAPAGIGTVLCLGVAAGVLMLARALLAEDEPAAAVT